MRFRKIGCLRSAIFAENPGNECSADFAFDAVARGRYAGLSGEILSYAGDA